MWAGKKPSRPLPCFLCVYSLLFHEPARSSPLASFLASGPTSPWGISEAPFCRSWCPSAAVHCLVGVTELSEHLVHKPLTRRLDSRAAMNFLFSAEALFVS